MDTTRLVNIVTHAPTRAAIRVLTAVVVIHVHQVRGDQFVTIHVVEDVTVVCVT